MVKSFAGSLDGMLALFLTFFPILTPAHGPRLTLEERAAHGAPPASDIEWAPLDQAHTCPFSHSGSTLDKHDAAAQTQPWASQKSGRFQESRLWNESAFV